MIHFFIMLPILSLVLLIILFLKYKPMTKKHVQNSQSTVESKKTYKLSQLLHNNNREHFRVHVVAKTCLIEFKEFEDKKLDKLLYKIFDATLENVSMGGFKFISRYNLPINQSIIIQVTFSLNDKDFNLTGEIVRKEEFNHNKLVGYGVRFLAMSEEQQYQLLRVLNQIILDRKQNDDNIDNSTRIS